MNTLYHSLRQIVFPEVANLDGFNNSDEFFCSDEVFQGSKTSLPDHSSRSVQQLCMGKVEREIRQAFLLFFVRILNEYHTSLFFLNSKMPVFNSVGAYSIKIPMNNLLIFPVFFVLG